MGQWWICPADGQVVIDDASVVGLTVAALQLPANAADAHLIFWHGTSGEILHKHSTTFPVRETFIDVSPYVPAFDGWMVAAQNETPPINLTQAKSVKSKMTQSLFESKRQLPINVGGVVYDASDTNMQTLMGGLTTDALIAAINAAIATFNARITAFNNGIVTHNTNSGLQDQVIQNGIVSNVNSDVIILNQGSYVAAINDAIDSVTVTMVGDPPTPSTSFTPMPTPQSLLPVWGAEANGQQVPILQHLESFPPVSLAQSTNGAVVNAISQRTTQLNNVRTTHLNNIAAQTTVAGVAAYNILAGW